MSKATETFTAYDPKVVDDRVEYLNSVFNSDDFQRNKELEKQKDDRRSRDPRVKHLDNYRQKTSENKHHGDNRFTKC